jgi:hypothetical protein
MKSNTIKFQAFDSERSFQDNDIQSGGSSKSKVTSLEIEKLMKPIVKDELEKLRVSKPHLFVK